MNYLIGFGIYTLVLVGLFAVSAQRNNRRTQKNLERFIEKPAQIAAVYRDGPDDEGYTHLYVQSIDGERLHVAYHENVAEAEQKLQRAMARGSADSISATFTLA